MTSDLVLKKLQTQKNELYLVSKSVTSGTMALLCNAKVFFSHDRNKKGYFGIYLAPNHSMFTIYSHLSQNIEIYCQRGSFHFVNEQQS